MYKRQNCGPNVTVREAGLRRTKRIARIMVEISFKADVDPKEISERSERFDSLLFDGALSCLRSATPTTKKSAS